MHLNMIHDTKIIPVLASAVAGTSSLTTAVVDMQGFESVAFIAMLGDVTANSALALTGQGGEVSDGSDAVDLAAVADHVADANNADNKLMILDLHRPRQRYVRATLDRATANAVLSGVIAILYNTNDKPVLQSDDVIAFTFVNDPATA